MLKRLLLFTAVALAVAAPSSAEGFRVGRAKTVITPPAGMPMAGSYRLRLSEGVHDDLHAKAVVMERDGVRVALVACDLVAVSDGIVADARKIIERSSGIPAANVMISATHTHSGPFIPGRGSFDDEFGRNMPVVAKFREQLPQQIAAAVALAAADLQPARVFAGRGEEGSVAFNRRFLMKDGSIRTNPGSNNPDIVRPVGPIDPTVAVALFVSDDEKQTPLATYVNYPLHVAVAGGMQFSADFPGVISELLSRVKGEQMLTLFTAGACGNINHLNVDNSREHPSRQPGANRIGVILAAEILKTYAELEEVQPNALQISSRVLDLPKIELSDAEIADARRVAAMAGTDNDPGTRPLAQAFARLDIIGRNGQPFQKEVQVISLGDAMAWAALPGEIFVEHGLRLKTMSPFRHTMLVELANGWTSYVPDRKAMPEGGYEVISARCGSGCGEAMVDAAVEMLIDDHAKTLPMTGLSLKR